MSFSFVLLLAGIVLGAIIGHLLVRHIFWIKGVKQQLRDSRPDWERMSDHYEQLALMESREAERSRKRGHLYYASKHLDEATRARRMAQKVRDDALEAMMEGKIL